MSVCRTTARPSRGGPLLDLTIRPSAIHTPPGRAVAEGQAGGQVEGTSHLNGPRMSTDLSFVEHVAEQAHLGQRLTWRRMFGEFALYIDGKVVAFACDDSLFIKPAAPTASLVKGLPQRPPYPGAKLYPVADELLDDPERLQALLLATWEAVPAKKSRRKK